MPGNFMTLNFFDIVMFLGFIAFVIVFSMAKSRREKTSEDFFLASRGLPWWIIGFSLIAANTSTEQFVGMNGSAAGNVSLAIASYNWMASITLVLVAIFILPHLLKSDIFTIPEFLEYRYNAAARGIMAFCTMLIYVTVTITAVLYSGGLTIHTIFGFDLALSVWIIGIITALYTTWGGLKAVVWADLFLCTGLLVGGFCVTAYGLSAVGGPVELYTETHGRFHMFLDSGHPELPWTVLAFGLWIPNFYYWGLNQYIAQRTLAARSLRDGQLGVLLAASMHVIMPLIVVLPGIIAIRLYHGEVSANPDAAFPILIRNLIPPGLRGFIFAAISGAVISSLASMLNAASTIFTMDIVKRHIHRNASQTALVTMGRVMTVLFVVVGCLIAPMLGDPRFRGVFHYIQDFQGYISPGILAAFTFGMIVKRAPGAAGVAALLVNITVYGILHLSMFEHIVFLNKMAITFTVIILVMAAITLAKPLKEPVVLPLREDIAPQTEPVVKRLGIVITIIIIALYIIFR